MDLNKVMIIGRLTRDPELRNIPSGQSVTSFGLATNRSWKGKDGEKQDQVEYHNIVLWARLAEIASQYLKKGSRIYMEGRLQTRDWTGQDGSKKRSTEIIGENMIMLDGPKGSGAPSNNNVSNANNATPNNDIPVINIDTPTNAPEAFEEEVKVEDIPF